MAPFPLDCTTTRTSTRPATLAEAGRRRVLRATAPDPTRS